MGSMSQNAGLLNAQSEWASKYGIKSAEDLAKADLKKFGVTGGTQETTDEAGNKIPGQEGEAKYDLATLQSMYAQDKANQEAFDQAPETRAARQAEEFSKRAPKLKEEMAQGAEAETKRQLASGLAQTRQNASSRGLLYSGIRQGTESTQRGMAGAQMAQARADINESVDEQVAKMRQGAIGAGFKAYDSAVAQAQADYNSALKNYKNRNAMIGQIGGALGMAGGMALGGAPGAMVGSQVGGML